METHFIHQIAEETKKYLSESKVVELPVAGYTDYIETGERLSFETAYFARRRQAAVLALDFLQRKDEQTKGFLEQVLWEICNEYTWALPAHLPIEETDYTGNTTDNASKWIDLFAAETGQMLAEILELMGVELAPIIQRRIRVELENRILSPFEERVWAWESVKSNWSAVVGGSIGMVALSMLPKNSARQIQLLKKVDNSMQAYLSSFGEDGACEEGLSYWAYGFGYYIYFAEKYSQVLKDDKYLRGEKIKRMASFPYYMVIDKEVGIPFSDYHPSELPSGLVSFCKDYFQVPIPEVKQINELDYDHCYRFAALYRNLQWTKKSVGEKKEIAHYFSDVQWGIFQSKERDLVFAAKGGRNDESHNHIDIGHFVFGSLKECYLTDLGAGEYTKAYFDEAKRYQFLVNSAQGHSLPIIDGHYQQPGSVAAKETRFVPVENYWLFETNLSNTYQMETNTKLIRQLLLYPSNRTVKLQDLVERTTEKTDIIENFVTTLPVEIVGQTLRIIGQVTNEICELTFTGTVQLKKVSYQAHDGTEKSAALIQFLETIKGNGKVQLTIRMISEE